jgi:hypothetical protein
MSTARKITPECQPVFPCWLWIESSIADDAWERCEVAPDYVRYATHWHPDQATAPEPVNEPIWCAACGRWGNHGSGTCPTIWHPTPPKPEATATDWAEQAIAEASESLFNLSLPAKDDCQTTIGFWKANERRRAECAFKVFLRHHAAQIAQMEHPDSIDLRAWQEAFGTSQLTHALARVESAERKAAQLVRDSGAELALETARENDLPYRHLRAIDVAIQKLRAITGEGENK